MSETLASMATDILQSDILATVGYAGLLATAIIRIHGFQDALTPLLIITTSMRERCAYVGAYAYLALVFAQHGARILLGAGGDMEDTAKQLAFLEMAMILVVNVLFAILRVVVWILGPFDCAQNAADLPPLMEQARLLLRAVKLGKTAGRPKED